MATDVARAATSAILAATRVVCGYLNINLQVCTNKFTVTIFSRFFIPALLTLRLINIDSCGEDPCIRRQINSAKFSKITVSEPILLAKDGQIVREGMKAARFNDEEYHSLMRLHGRDLSEIEESYLEMNGQVSFLKKQD